LDTESDSPHSRASHEDETSARMGASATRNLQDRKIETKGIHLIVDAQSWRYVEHLKLDYSEDLMGGGFRFYNPQIKNTCGCGISFAAIE
ncbi:MAG: iron-sulfur cluster assembly accessory protein, partial [Waterburya sp.]